MTTIGKWIAGPFIAITYGILGTIGLMIINALLCIGGAEFWSLWPTLLGGAVGLLVAWIAIVWVIALLYLLVAKPILWVAGLFGRRRAEWEGDADEVAFAVIVLTAIFYAIREIGDRG